MDGYHHQVFIQYTPQEELNISLIDATQHHHAASASQIQPVISIQLKLNDYI
jgi:hypothetical protein